MFSDVVVQAYALVLVVDQQSRTITAVSTNTEALLLRAPESLIGKPLAELFPADSIEYILQEIKRDFPVILPFAPPEDWVANTRQQAIIHAFGGELIIEIEPRADWPPDGDYAARLNDFTYELETAPSIEDLLERLCECTLTQFGFQRVIVMQFDHLGNSVVTHEAREEDYNSYLDIHFVDADVPAGNRYNQIVGMVHLFHDVDAPRHRLAGDYRLAAKEMLKRYVACRGPRPNTVQFLRDNDLTSLGYLSLVVNGKLWGSVYMHGKRPMYFDHQMRTFLRIVGRITQQKIAYHLSSRALRLRQAANAVRDKLQEYIANADTLAEGLTGGEKTLLDLIPHTTGAAICSDETLTLFQTTPSEAEVTDLIKWIEEQDGLNEPWHTETLATVFPRAADFQDKAAGVLFLPLDVAANQWIAWFRPEQQRTVTYGSQNGGSYRRFEAYDAAVHGHAMRWTSDDIGNALALQSFLKDIVMKRFTHSQRRNRLLQQAYDDLEVFSYTVGHDLRAPLRGITSFADILEEDFGDALGEEGMVHLRYIQDNAERMRVFMNDLLALSRIDRSGIIVNSLSVSELVNQALRDRATSEIQAFTIDVQDDIPPILGDENQMQTVFINLISNAIKYSAARDNPCIHVGYSGTYNGFPLFFIEDNGIGIPAEQVDRVFELFNRAGNVGKVAGTGIGLSLVKRIISIHEGEVWIESEEGVGTRFLFYSGMRKPTGG